MLIDYRTDSASRQGDQIVRAAARPAPSMRRRLAVAVGWSIAGGTLWQGCALLSSIVAARLIGKQSFGHLATVQATAIALTNLASLGLGVTATKYVSQLRESDPRRAGRILGLSSIVALIASTVFALALVACAPRIAHKSFQTADLTSELRWSAVYVFFIIMNGYQAGALSGLESFRRLTQVSMAYGISSLISMSLGSYWLGERGAVLAFSFGAFLLWLWHQVALVQELRRFQITISYRDAWQERAALVRFALPATFSGAVGSIAIWSCYCWLVQYRGFAEMAVYMAATNLRAAVVFVPNLVTRVTTPLLNNLLAAGRSKTGVRMFWLSVGANTWLAIVVAFVLVAAGPQMLRWFGRDFLAGRTLLALIMASAVLEVLSGNLYQATFARRSLYGQIAAISVWAAILVGMTRLLVVPFGASGLAAAYTACGTVSALMYLALAKSLRSSTHSEAACGA